MAVSELNQRLYLSGGASNADPKLSIGGAKSSVQISATALGALFDNVTGSEATAGQDDYRLLYYQNVDTDPVGAMDVAAFLTQPNVADVATGEVLELGIAAAGKNAVEDAIADENTAPADVTFDDSYLDYASGLVLPDGPYEQDDYVGIWVHRHTPALQAYNPTGTDAAISLGWES